MLLCPWLFYVHRPPGTIALHNAGEEEQNLPSSGVLERNRWRANAWQLKVFITMLLKLLDSWDCATVLEISLWNTWAETDMLWFISDGRKTTTKVIEVGLWALILSNNYDLSLSTRGLGMFAALRRCEWAGEWASETMRVSNGAIKARVWAVADSGWVGGEATVAITASPKWRIVWSRDWEEGGGHVWERGGWGRVQQPSQNWGRDRKEMKEGMDQLVNVTLGASSNYDSPLEVCASVSGVLSSEDLAPVWYRTEPFHIAVVNMTIVNYVHHPCHKIRLNQMLGTSSELAQSNEWIGKRWNEVQKFANNRW